MQNIVIEKINTGEALRYMGHKGQNIDSSLLNIIKECESRLLSLIHPKYTYKVFDISIEDNGVNVLGTNLVLTGNAIKKHLKGCEKAVLMCATLSGDVDKYIRLCEIQDMTKAVILDAMASAAIEQVCDKIEEELGRLYAHKHFTYRFGLGYGDLPLALEPIFLNIIDAPKKIGVCSSESYILSPRKSVVCVIGISSNIIEKNARNCLTCNMQGKCQFRRRGEHCGI